MTIPPTRSAIALRQAEVPLTSETTQRQARADRGRHVILHVGIHKTGTTSFQEACWRHRDHLLAHGVAWFAPPTKRSNAAEVSNAILRSSVNAGRHAVRDVDAVRASLATFAAAHPDHDMLISAEGLSFIRDDAECDRLRALLPATGRTIRVLVVLRDVDDWWASYVNEIRKMQDRAPTAPGSYADLNRHGWLTDFDTMLAVFRRNFGEVITLPYGREIVPSLFRAMDVPLPDAYRPVRLNRRGPSPFLQRQVKKRFHPLYRRYLRANVVGRLWRRLKGALGLPVWPDEANDRREGAPGPIE